MLQCCKIMAAAIAHGRINFQLQGVVAIEAVRDIGQAIHVPSEPASSCVPTACTTKDPLIELQGRESSPATDPAGT